MQARLIDLESRFAFQEQAIHELSDVIARQQRQIDSLERELDMLKEYVKNITPSVMASEAEETPPPHY